MHTSLNKQAFAAIDLGSHTIRLLIARLEGKQIVPLHRDRRITRLAKNFQEGQTLKQESIDPSLQVLREYSERLEQFGVSALCCGATGVVRRARNGEDFLQSIADQTRIKAFIVSERAEATLSAKGILSVLPSPEGLILSFDLGGSSTEFFLIDTAKPDPLLATSVFIGAATITERCLPGNPPSMESVAGASEAIRNALAPTIDRIKQILQASYGSSAAFQLVGTAGTVTTLAAMYLKMVHYEPFRVNGLTLTPKWIAGTVRTLSGMSFEQRKQLEGLEGGREDIILGGALVVREILDGFGLNQLIVTDGGLLEGLLLDLIEKELERPHTLAPHLTWRFQKE